MQSARFCNLNAGHSLILQLALPAVTCRSQRIIDSYSFTVFHSSQKHHEHGCTKWHSKRCFADRPEGRMQCARSHCVMAVHYRIAIVVVAVWTNIAAGGLRRGRTKLATCSDGTSWPMRRSYTVWWPHPRAIFMRRPYSVPHTVSIRSQLCTRCFSKIRFN